MEYNTFTNLIRQLSLNDSLQLNNKLNENIYKFNEILNFLFKKSPSIILNLIPKKVTPDIYVGIVKINNKYIKELSYISLHLNTTKFTDNYNIKYKLIGIESTSYNNYIYEITIYKK